MTTWLDKLCEPLLHPKYPQIKGRLVEFDSNHKIIGKCAEGEILCQNQIMFDPNIQSYMIYNSQFRELRVPEDLLEYVLPNLFDPTVENMNIHSYIVGLNDSGSPYPEIAEFLRTTFEDAV